MCVWVLILRSSSDVNVDMSELSALLLLLLISHHLQDVIAVYVCIYIYIYVSLSQVDVRNLDTKQRQGFQVRKKINWTQD